MRSAINFKMWMLWTAKVLSVPLLVGCLASCSNETEGDPLGPSNVEGSLIQVIPASATIAKGDTLPFTASGGTGTVRASLGTRASVLEGY